jgi:hypothetical protein
MAVNLRKPCPRCGGPIPNAAHEGQYPGALSRTDNQTEVCSACGAAEAGEQAAGLLTPKAAWASRGGR